MKMNFASDNCAGAHPDVLKYIEEVNKGYVASYGADEYSLKAADKIKEIFEAENAEVYFALTGTAANIISLASVLSPYQAVICPDTAHINVDECGAPERFTGSKIISVPNKNGKLTVDDIKAQLHGIGFEHHSQPAMISISQATELGSLYTPEELTDLCDFAHYNGLAVHMDGSRFANAVASLGVRPAEITTEVGVDILSFGGTKNGMAIGEAVVFFNKGLCTNTKYIRKQAMQLFSKMRFISGQFLGYFNEGLWIENALHANECAVYFADKLRETGIVEVVGNVQTNAVFSIMPEAVRDRIMEEYFFYVWNEETGLTRLMTSFATKKEEVDEFVNRFVEIAKEEGLVS